MNYEHWSYIGIRLSPEFQTREEQNFVVQNEINNLSFLTGDNKTKMSKVGFVFARHLSTLSTLDLKLAIETINSCLQCLLR